MNFIDNVSTENTGGGCMVDIIELCTGRVVVISDEVIGLYANRKAWEDGGELPESRMIEVAGGFTRCEKSTEGLTFVETITTHEASGPVSVDVLHLAGTGRVIGIDDETVCLHKTLDDMLDGVPDVEGCLEFEEATRVVPMEWHCEWHQPEYEEHTQDVRSTFFKTDVGYTFRDIGEIMMLNVGQQWTAPGMTRNGHTVTRTK